jgi:hypothetical protein
MRDAPLSFIALGAAIFLSPAWTPIDDQWVEGLKRKEPVLHCDPGFVECNEEGTCCTGDEICEPGGRVCFTIYHVSQ